MGKISKVWAYYDVVNSNEARCHKCPVSKKTLSTKGGSTKGLIDHLEKVHKIYLRKSRDTSANSANLDDSIEDGPLSSARQPEPVKSKMTDFFPKLDKSSQVISRLVAKDGLSFRVLTTSRDIRMGQEARGLTIPKSPNTVREKMFEYAKGVEFGIARELQSRREAGERFALTLDEWTGCNNRRYMNINIHMSGSESSERGIHNLGLVKIDGSFTSEACVEMVQKRLRDFNVDPKKDIICSTCDGASVMRRYGTLMGGETQLCFSHAIHLAVSDVLYNSVELTVEVNNDQELLEVVDVNGLIDLDKNTDAGDSSFDVEEATGPATLKINLADAIQKVRNVVKMFRKSPKRNGALQKIIKTDTGTEKQLDLDVRTRWNSLLTMIDTYLKVRTSIRKALVVIEIEDEHVITHDEITILTNVRDALQPIEMVINTLGSHESTLISANAAVEFMLNELDDMYENSVAKNLRDALETRLDQRKSDVFLAANVLSKGGQTTSFTEINAVKYVLISMAEKLELVPLSTSTSSTPSAASTTSNVTTETTTALTMAKRLKLKMAQSMTDTANLVTTSRSTESIIGRELDFLRSTGTRGRVLDKVFNAILSIPPTSVEAERAFSASGLFLSRVRSRLGDRTISSLVMLRKHFQKEDKQKDEVVAIDEDDSVQSMVAELPPSVSKFFKPVSHGVSRGVTTSDPVVVEID